MSSNFFTPAVSISKWIAEIFANHKITETEGDSTSQDEKIRRVALVKLHSEVYSFPPREHPDYIDPHLF